MSTNECRFVITEDCCFKCGFCHREGMQNEKKQTILNAEDYSFIFNTAKDTFGYHTATVTGGEPLCHANILDILHNLYEADASITLVTNGYYIAKKIEVFKYVTRVNVSLHCLNESIFNQIVNHPHGYKTVISNLKLLRSEYPNLEICLNIPLSKGINNSKEAIIELIKYSNDISASIKFIELYPNTLDDYIPFSKIIPLLKEQRFKKEENETRKTVYKRNETIISLGKIFCAEAVVHKYPVVYCNRNNDIVFTPDGKIKLCRHSDFEIDCLRQIKQKLNYEFENILLSTVEILGKNCILKHIDRGEKHEIE